MFIQSSLIHHLVNLCSRFRSLLVFSGLMVTHLQLSCMNAQKQAAEQSSVTVNPEIKEAPDFLCAFFGLSSAENIIGRLPLDVQYLIASQVAERFQPYCLTPTKSELCPDKGAILIDTLAFNNDSSQLAYHATISTNPRCSQLLSVKGNEPSQKVENFFQEQVEGIAFNKEGSYLALVGLPGLLGVIAPLSHAEEGNQGETFDIPWERNDKLICCYDNTGRFHVAASEDEIEARSLHKYTPGSSSKRLCFDSHGKLIIATVMREIFVYNPQAQALQSAIIAYCDNTCHGSCRQAVRTLSINHDASCIAYGSKEHGIELMRISEKKCTVLQPASAVGEVVEYSHMHFSADDTKLITLSKSDGTQLVQILNLHSRECMISIPLGQQPIASLCLHPHLPFILIARQQAPVQIYHVLRDCS